MSSGEVIAVLASLAAIFMTGALFGLHLAWSQEKRMARWAAKYADLYDRFNGGNS